jgi:hypothetical protein
VLGAVGLLSVLFFPQLFCTASGEEGQIVLSDEMGDALDALAPSFRVFVGAKLMEGPTETAYLKALPVLHAVETQERKVMTTQDYRAIARALRILQKTRHAKGQASAVTSASDRVPEEALYRFFVEALHDEALYLHPVRDFWIGQTAESLAPHLPVVKPGLRKVLLDESDMGETRWFDALWLYASKCAPTKQEKDAILQVIDRCEAQGRCPPRGTSAFEKKRWMVWSIEARYGRKDAESALIEAFREAMASDTRFSARRGQGPYLISKLAFTKTNRCVKALLGVLEAEYQHSGVSVAGYVLRSLCKTHPELEEDIFSPSYDAWLSREGTKPTLAVLGNPDVLPEDVRSQLEETREHFSRSEALRDFAAWAERTYGMDIWSKRGPDIWLEAHLIRGSL